MMIVYGSGGGRSVLGEAGTHECQACKQTAVFTAVCDYSYWHVYWLCSLVTGRQYSIVCGNCGNATPIDKAAIRAQFPKDNIPLIRRFGWLLFPAAIAFAVMLAVGVGEAKRALTRPSKTDQRQQVFNIAAARNRINKSVKSPTVGDAFLVNLFHVSNSGFGDIESRQAWGGLKLVALEDGQGTFVTSTRAWEAREGLKRALEKSGEVVYDTESPLILPTRVLGDLNGKNYVMDVIPATK